MDTTIAAICTPPGEGGIAVIRISGEDAISIASEIFNRDVASFASHTAHLGKISSKKGEMIDEVLLLVMHKGRSYTGEETVEIMCHGGIHVTNKVLQRVLEAGAKAAGPGEFTYRAYKNGNIDLVQAEAIQQLIGAKNDEALQAAEQQLDGSLSIRIRDLQQCITDVTAIIEAWVDYPEEGLEFASVDEIIEMLTQTLQKGEKLEQTFHEGKVLFTGVSLCFLGLPNVGKSSLLNALLQTDRAIVTDIAGTTRDILEEQLTFGGLNFSVTDTAGIRESDEIIEQEGIRRSRKAAQGADIILLILDATREQTEEEANLLKEFPDSIVVYNKIDLIEDPNTLPGIPISAKMGDGIKVLQEEIVRHVKKGRVSSKGEVIITKERHFQALEEANRHIAKAIKGLREEISPEFLAFDLRSALHALSRIIGTNVTEEILGAIFSKFCVGK